MAPRNRPTAPSRRKPRRAEPVRYRVRVELDGSKPPVWRGLELTSDICLDEVHEVLQTAFDWDDAHLNVFFLGADPHDPAGERYLCPFQVQEGDSGIPQSQVRLDETLAEPGDVLFYCYDFGDEWVLTVRLIEVVADAPDRPRASCFDGDRPAPAEDCGGVGTFELICAALDADSPRRDAARAEFAEFMGEEVDPNWLAPSPFDQRAVDDALAAEFGSGAAQATTELPPALRDLASGLPSSSRRRLRGLVRAASLDEAIELDVETATATVRPFAHLLDVIGDGVALTSAGYLPPAVVERLFHDLDMAADWIGKGNREDLTPPVRHLRETAQRTGLLRKHKGKLLPTAKGRALREDPVALWWHVAGRLSGGATRSPDREAGLLYLLALAAGSTDRVYDFVAETLAAAGWRDSDHRPISAADIGWVTGHVTEVLELLGGLRRVRGKGRQVEPGAVLLARAALRDDRQ